MASTRASLNESNLSMLRIIIPERKVLSSFQETANSIRLSILKQKDEIAMLTSIRDWLLPVLMNGQATIAD